MSTQLNQTVANSFCSAVDTMVTQAINSAEYDKTISAEIIEVIDASIGKYRVKYQDASFYAYSENTSATYRKGVLVQVLIPKGDMSHAYKTILGATSRVGVDYVEEPDTAAVYVKNGSGCLIQEEDIVISTKGGETTLYKYGKEENAISLINLVEIESYMKNSSSMLFSCFVKTDIPADQRRLGKYGIKVKLALESDVIKPENYEEAIKEFIFDTDDVLGTPYYLPIYTEQEKVFDLDKGNFTRIEEISVFAEGFPEEDEGFIYFSDLNLFGTNMLDEKQVSTYHVDIATEQGKYFTKDKTSLPLTAKVYIKGKLANREEQKYKVYWFVKNAKVTNSHRLYHAEGRQGWACLNEALIDDNGDILEWVDGDSILTLSKNSFPAKESIIKCVIVYDSQSFESETTIYNNDASYTLNLICNQDVHFTNDIGEAVLTLEVNPAGNFNYVWNQVSLDGTTIQKQPAEGAPANQLTVQVKEINTSSKYNCSVYSADEAETLIGTASIELYNEAQAPEYTLSIVNGKQVFKYDLNGYSPTSPANEHQTSIKELSFEIYDKKGQKVKEEVIQSKITKDKIRWMIKNTQDSLIDISDYNDTEQDPQMNHYILRDRAINIKIKDRYSYSASQNQIQLEVVYTKDDGSTHPLTAITEFVFTKEGAQGTNGTDAVCWVGATPSSKKTFYEIPVGLRKDYQPTDGQTKFNFNVKTSGEIDTKPVTGELDAQVTLLSRKVGDGTQSWLDSTWQVVFPQENNWSSDKNLKQLNHILQARASIGGCYCSNILPIVFTRYVKFGDYLFKLKDNTGFLNVYYETNGKYPKYDSDKPFEIEIYEKGKILTEEEIRAKLTGNKPTLKITWGGTDLLQVTPISVYGGYQCDAKPSENYDSYSYAQAVFAKIFDENDNLLAVIHIPIYFYINKYFNANINKWDGNGIEIDEKSGIILSPQVGAGTKHEEDNTFTGVIIGTREDYSEKKEPETGLFGYNHGAQTLFLNAQDGSALFGAAGQGQIVIKPGTKENASATITGGDYNYDPTGANGQGMQIDLGKDPSIKFGTGNFEVAPNGFITAKGGGSIAGWNIDNYKIFKDTTGMSSVDSRETEGVTEGDFAKLNKKALAFWAGKEVEDFPNLKDFMVAHDGSVKMRTAVIGKGVYEKDADDNITDTNIYIGGGESRNSSIYSGKSFFKDGYNGGFYLGADGLSIGKTLIGGKTQNANAFEVSKDGDVRFRSGKIGFDKDNPDFDDNEDSHNYWTIDGNAIKYGNKTTYNDAQDGIYIGTDGIGLGKGMFYVNAAGEVVGKDLTILGGGIKIYKGDNPENTDDLVFYTDEKNNLILEGGVYATLGNIGGWTIEATKLSANGIDIDGANGAIKGGSDWEIDGKGNATFNNIKANGGTIGGITISKDSLGNPTGLSAGTGGGSGTGFSIGKGGSITASGATVTGKLTATQFNFNDNKGHYLNMGETSEHPNISGLNVQNGGISMDGNHGISNCPNIGNSSNLTITSTNGKVELEGSTLWLKGGSGTRSIMVYSGGWKSLFDYVKGVVDGTIT